MNTTHRINKAVSLAVAVLSLAAGAAGCGSSKHSSGQSSSGAAVSTSSSAAASAPSASSSTAASAPSTSESSGSSTVDYRTVDPCALVSPQAIQSFASHAKQSVNYTGYDSCGINLAKGKQGWLVEMDMSNTFPVNTAQQISQVYRAKVKPGSEHGTTIYEGDGPAGCLRAVNLPANGPTLVIRVTARADKPCTAAEAALHSAMAAVSSGAVKQLPLPAGSLARVDFCASLAKAAGALLGQAITGRPTSAHGCQWSDGTNKTLLVSLQSAPWPPEQLAQGKVKQVAGHTVDEQDVPAKQGEFVQAAVKFGRPAAFLTAPGEFDSVSVLSAVRGTGAGQLPQKLQPFLAAVAGAQAN